MKKGFILVLLAILTTAGISAETNVYSLEFGIQDFGFLVGDLHSSDSILVGVFRQARYPWDVGLYRATEITMGGPIATIASSEDEKVTVATENDFYVSLFLPFGFRTYTSRSRMGVFVGVGPAVQWIQDFQGGGIGGFGFTGEIGLESNNLNKTSFHMGFKIGMSPLVFDSNGQILDDVMAVETAFKFGVAWRKKSG